MRCPKCNRENNDSAKFCAECGNNIKAIPFDNGLAQKTMLAGCVNRQRISNNNWLAAIIISTPGAIIIGIVLLYIIYVLTFSLPVEFKYRKAVMSSGYVVQVLNASNKSIRLTFNSRGKSTSFILDAYACEEFGWVQGYDFASGDQFSVTSDFLKSKCGYIP